MHLPGVPFSTGTPPIPLRRRDGALAQAGAREAVHRHRPPADHPRAGRPGPGDRRRAARRAARGGSGDPEQLATTSKRWGPRSSSSASSSRPAPTCCRPPTWKPWPACRTASSRSPSSRSRRSSRARSGRGSRRRSSISIVPLAAASLGQVHRARLRDGRPVAVKVQRPDIRQVIVDDLEVIEEIAAIVDDTPRSAAPSRSDMVEEFRTYPAAELDYRREAVNLVTLGENLADYRRLVIPRRSTTTRPRGAHHGLHRDGRSPSSPPLARIDLDHGSSPRSCSRPISTRS